MTFPGIWGGRERIEVGPAAPRARLVAADADAAEALARPARDDLRRRRRAAAAADGSPSPGEACNATGMSIPRIPAPWRIPVATERPGLVELIHYTDAACPWAYNFEPALRTLEARYGDQLSVRTVMIGLSESHKEYEARGYTAEGTSLTRLRFRWRGMPMATGPRSRPFGTAPACRLVKAAELQGVPQAEAVLRNLRFGVVHDRSRDGHRRGAARGGRERRRARRRARARRRGDARGRGGLPARPRRDAQPDALLRHARPHGRDRRARPLHRAEHRAARRRAASSSPRASSPSRRSTCSS